VTRERTDDPYDDASDGPSDDVNRVLVLGATGYVGSRVVPALVGAGHTVRAASSSVPAPGRFGWGDDVEWARCDVTSAHEVAAALTDVDTVVYLVHSLTARGFAGRDLLGAQTVRDGVERSGVRRVVYLSGLVPDVGPDELSAHLASRLEVEEELLRVSCSAVALRAGVVVGAGSTSWEVVRQVGALLVVQPVPTWLRSSVQPVAASDAVRALVEAVASDHLQGAVDVGGPDVLPYPRLLRLAARAERLVRVRVPVLAAPEPLVALVTAALVQAPFRTVVALVGSLRHDMVCRPGHTWVPADGEPLLPVADAVRRSLAATGEWPEAPLASDPAWTRQRATVLDTVLAPRSVRAGTSLALHRLRNLAGRA
jgi:uncharacterized protein YbjT (DUF2867 family)